MAEYSKDVLKNFKPTKEFFVGVDSDGCAYPTMELKHKECFIPNIINEWDLQSISKYVREAAEWVNLYSKFRGVNRFPALTKTFDLLNERPEVQKSKVTIPDVDSLRKFIDSGVPLGNPSLEKAVEETGDPVLAKALKWSKAVNDSVAGMVRGAYPFPYVKESIELMIKQADIVVVSATPCEALEKEWKEHDLAKYVSIIAGQQMGNKKEHLKLASGSKYKKDHVLMIGDAPGDFKAARANDALFFPINPGNEESSWELFQKEAFDRFISGKYAGDYEKELIQKFEEILPDTPHWTVSK